ncbi:hypothetical protein IG631_14947 [Alternaria alternata]|nr:hypothetical protein IG631_14947 [Alternaria alternata]
MDLEVSSGSSYRDFSIRERSRRARIDACLQLCLSGRLVLDAAPAGAEGATQQIITYITCRSVATLHHRGRDRYHGSHQRYNRRRRKSGRGTTDCRTVWSELRADWSLGWVRDVPTYCGGTGRAQGTNSHVTTWFPFQIAKSERQGAGCLAGFGRRACAETSGWAVRENQSDLWAWR